MSRLTYTSVTWPMASSPAAPRDQKKVAHTSRERSRGEHGAPFPPVPARGDSIPILRRSIPSRRTVSGKSACRQGCLSRWNLAASFTTICIRIGRALLPRRPRTVTIMPFTSKYYALLRISRRAIFAFFVPGQNSIRDRRD